MVSAARLVPWQSVGAQEEVVVELLALLEPPPQPTRTVAAAIGIRMRQSDIATRRVRARPAGFCIQPSIIAMTKRSAIDAIGAICRNVGGCNFIEG